MWHLKCLIFTIYEAKLTLNLDTINIDTTSNIVIEVALAMGLPTPLLAMFCDFRFHNCLHHPKKWFTTIYTNNIQEHVL
jgi:hypothetical protein